MIYALNDHINMASLNNPSEDTMKIYDDIPLAKEKNHRGNPIVRPLFAHSSMPEILGIKRKWENEVKPNEEFLYFVYMHHWDALSAKYLDRLSPFVLNAVREKRCKLILDNSLEGDTVFDFLTQLHISIIKLKLPLEQIFYITNNLLAKEKYQEWRELNRVIAIEAGVTVDHGVNVVTFMYDVHHIKTLIQRNKLPQRLDIYKEIQHKEQNLKNVKHFLKINRTGREERDLFMLHVNKHNLYDKFDISYPSFHGVERLPRFLFPELRHPDNIISLKNKLPFDIDEQDRVNHGPPGVGPGKFNADLEFLPHIYRNTFMSVVMCAFPFVHGACHLHASTYNPMWCGHPILQFGPHGHLRLLKKNGFRTFDKWWDESYDNELNGWERFQSVLNIVDDLSTLSKKEMLKMYIDMKDVIEHNIANMHAHQGIFKLKNSLGIKLDKVI